MRDNKSLCEHKSQMFLKHLFSDTKVNVESRWERISPLHQRMGTKGQGEEGRMHLNIASCRDGLEGLEAGGTGKAASLTWAKGNKWMSKRLSQSAQSWERLTSKLIPPQTGLGAEVQGSGLSCSRAKTSGTLAQGFHFLLQCCLPNQLSWENNL